MKIDLVDINSIRPANWRATHILLPDLKLLTASMLEAGWLSPVVARVADRTIVDGFARWLVPQNSKEFVKKYGDKVPVVWVDIDEIDAMVLHIRMNRARGILVAKFLSPLVQEILASKKYARTELAKMLKMTGDELDLLTAGTLIKQRNIKEHQYEKAWVPVEVPAGSIQTNIVLERPPNPDR